MTPIGGGVSIQPRIALNGENMRSDETGEINQAKNTTQVLNLAPDQWWWD